MYLTKNIRTTIRKPILQYPSMKYVFVLSAENLANKELMLCNINVCVRDTQEVKQRKESSGLSHVTYNVLPDSCGKVLEFKCFVKYRLPIVDQLD